VNGCALDAGVSYGCPAGSVCTSDHFGRFCREQCSSATCRAGYACHENTDYRWDGPRTCMPLCTSDAQCSRDLGASYGCNLFSRRCELKDKGLPKYGANCSNNSQCESGICLSDPGYCEGLCIKSGACGADGVCGSDGTSDQTGRCFDQCTGASDCTRPSPFQCAAPPYGGSTSNVCYCRHIDEPCRQASDCCNPSPVGFPPTCLIPPFSSNGNCTF
jgi:hypothetical protein